MAVKDHSLDGKITRAAFDEFLEYGFQNASINKIAERACVTTGAIYTRYKNKDSLFSSLLEDILNTFKTRAQPVAENYYKAEQTKNLDDFLAAMAYETEVYIDVIFKHYEDAILLFCKSDGSTVEDMLKEMINHKTTTTLLFFEKIAKQPFDHNAIRILMNSQAYFYRQLLEAGYEKTEAKACMTAVQSFLASGWKHLFEQLNIT